MRLLRGAVGLEPIVFSIVGDFNPNRALATRWGSYPSSRAITLMLMGIRWPCSVRVLHGRSCGSGIAQCDIVHGRDLVDDVVELLLEDVPVLVVVEAEHGIAELDEQDPAQVLAENVADILAGVDILEDDDASCD